jgi:hypothetical protein
MLYTAHELSEELSVPDNTLRCWLQAGAPFYRDAQNHIWIDGTRFSTWVKEQQRKKPSNKLKAGEGYCLNCNRTIQFVPIEVRHIQGKLVHLKGKCPQCGHTINRGARYDRTAELY